MKFNKLRVVGFKSFVESSEFIIERGLTGVVGPNGCGKSNLVEALRWVMGENSYKNMRASGMDDVIFSGSGNRPARNTAEVSLYLDNSDRTAPAAFNDSDEIQVTRRIEREHGSVYRINGKESRAKDVQLLFADASTGARSPSMVGQGRIGELIAAKPQARRQLLEEAAGISGLHSRRHEAELRLKAAETNLERLDDVTAQIETQIDSLKRQARQANRFKALSADIRAREAMLLHIAWSQARQAEAEADHALNAATVVVAEKAQAQMEAAKRQAIGSLKLPDLREAEARAAAGLQRLQIARSQLEEDAGRIARRRDELTRRVTQLAEDIRREELLVADNAGFLARLDDEEGELAELLDSAARHTEETRDLLEEAEARLRDSEAVFAEITAERAQAIALRAQTERTLHDLADRQRKIERQIVEVTQGIDAIESKISALPDPEEKRAILDAAETAAEEAGDVLDAAEDALAQARQTEAQLRPPADAARTRLNAAQTEARTIENMLAAASSGDRYKPIADAVHVDRGYETAVGAALGNDLESALDRNAPVFWLENGAGTQDPLLPEGADPLFDHVKAPAALSRRLRQIGVVSTVEQAEALMPALRAGQRLVTLAGAVYRWDGHVTGAEAPSAATLRLSQRNRLVELGEEVIAARAALAAAQSDLDGAVAAMRGAELAVNSARETSRLALRAMADAREGLAVAERASGDLLRRKEVLAQNLANLELQQQDLIVQAEDARAAFEDMADLVTFDRQLHAQQAAVAADRGAVAQARAQFESLDRENVARRRRLAAIATERQNWQARADNAQSHIATLREREDEAREELADLAIAPDEFDEKRRLLMNELEKMEAARRAAADQLIEAEGAQKQADQAAASALSDLAESRERRGRAEERLVSAREKRLEAEARIRAALNVPPHEAWRLAGAAPGDHLPDLRNVERELDRLKMERERLGAVNLRADEEHEELSLRLKTLIDERDDVIDAIRKLRGAIQSLNREGRERLIAAFDVVNAQFQRLFIHLFGGGMAELQLIESDDPLEAGLEILARPPGKKPQTMTLLSGGEQALTAMALIFAVFLTNPAPICVLDEVDAPLDDHNVERYCNLMDEMAASTETRFIIITHNPITMARMNRLFGVTMAEQGVSQLVSVDLQAAEQLREPA